MIIAIDGYSSCGKSTFAKAIAARLGYVFIDTGAMYRAVTLFAMERKMVHNPGMIIDNLDEIDIQFKFNPTIQRSQIYLGSRNIDTEIRNPEVSSHVSAVSAIAQVREKLVTMQRQMGRHGNVVMDGRDIGTVVFPDAELKIFMTADPKVRAMRRYREMQQSGVEVSLSEIELNVISRDHQDETRSESPLRRANDAKVLDNSHMTVEQQMEWVMDLIQNLRA